MIRAHETVPAHQRGSGGQALTGRHVLLGMIAFFAVTLAVNSFMIYQAVSTFGGIETADAYRRGIAYNRRIAEGDQQSATGWSDRVEIARDPSRLLVSMRDRDGEPVIGLAMTAKIGRPATDLYDAEVKLREIGPGEYVAEIAAPGTGSWIADILASRSAEEPARLNYQARRRLWVKP
jgi:nitrogen fixation protein FixH